MNIATIPIRFYQRFLSPWKGYRCAYSVLRKSYSCSEYARLVIERFGLRSGWQLLKRRLRLCKTTYLQARAYQQREESNKNLFETQKKKQQDNFCDALQFCDLPLYSCDAVDLSACEGGIEICSCGIPSP